MSSQVQASAATIVGYFKDMSTWTLSIAFTGILQVFELEALLTDALWRDRGSIVWTNRWRKHWVRRCLLLRRCQLNPPLMNAITSTRLDTKYNNQRRLSQRCGLISLLPTCMQITTFGVRETYRVFIYVGMDFSNGPLWVDFSDKVRIQTAAAAYKKPEAALSSRIAQTDLIPNVWFAVS